MSFQGLTWNWPYLDVFLYRDDGDSIFVNYGETVWGAAKAPRVGANNNVQCQISPPQVLNKSEVLPARRIEFLGASVPVPKNVSKVLKKTFSAIQVGL